MKPSVAAARGRDSGEDTKGGMAAKAPSSPRAVSESASRPRTLSGRPHLSQAVVGHGPRATRGLFSCLKDRARTNLGADGRVGDPGRLP